MGLDMYLTVRKEGEEKEEIGYWRKHHDLHGWMSDLWERKGYPLPEEWDEERRAAHIDDGDFNCVPLKLTLKDINNVMKDIRANKLPPTTGFFFGDNPPDKETIKEDIKIFKTAKEYLQRGYTVEYDSWW
jgi:hypothetical protein